MMLLVMGRQRRMLAAASTLVVRRRGPVLVLVALVAGIAALRGLLGPVAWSVGGRTVGALAGKDRADAINAVRQVVPAGNVLGHPRWDGRARSSSGWPGRSTPGGLVERSAVVACRYARLCG
jgi:hypothetical protein